MIDLINHFRRLWNRQFDYSNFKVLILFWYFNFIVLIIFYFTILTHKFSALIHCSFVILIRFHLLMLILLCEDLITEYLNSIFTNDMPMSYLILMIIKNLFVCVILKIIFWMIQSFVLLIGFTVFISFVFLICFIVFICFAVFISPIF